MIIKGSIKIPGDKSISHRALMMASVAKNKSTINNISTGEDVNTTIKCLRSLGVELARHKNIVEVHGGKLKSPSKPLDCGNSGTTVRLIAGLLSGLGVKATLIGDKSLSKRPMDRIINPLRLMGQEISSKSGKLPINLGSNKDISGIEYILPVASAQIKSCILYAALFAKGRTTIKEPIKSRDHTEIMLKELGVNISSNAYIKIDSLKERFNSFSIKIPGDPSSAAFFAAAVALIPNSDLTIKNILANPTRIGFFDVLKSMGAGVEWLNIKTVYGELVGDVHIYYKPLNGIHIKKDMVPSVIDEIPIISILASQADSITIIEGAQELRYKESDRIHAICKNLKNMGIKVIERKDGLIIDPSNTFKQSKIVTFSDHRIAMAFAVAGLITPGGVKLDNLECIDISFPEFFKFLKDILK